MDVLERTEYERAKKVYRRLSPENQTQIDHWIRVVKETFYDYGRPYYTHLQCPSIRGISQRSIFSLLYIAMDYDQVSSPPHTPPLSPRTLR